MSARASAAPAVKIALMHDAIRTAGSQSWHVAMPDMPIRMGRPVNKTTKIGTMTSAFFTTVGA